MVFEFIIFFSIGLMYYFWQRYPEEDYLTGDQLMWEFNEEVKKAVLCSRLFGFFVCGLGEGAVELNI